MQLSELFLNRWLFREKQTIETLGADYVSSNIADAPSTAVASGNTVIDINSNAMTINGSQIAPGIADYGWTQTCAFTSTNLNTVTWGAGSFIAANGATYAISGGTTGVISGKKYVYLDTNLSITTYQVSANNDTYAAIGIGKVLIAVCQNAAIAVPQPNATFNLVQASQIVADNILANTIGANKLSVAQLSAITADMGALTAGYISVVNGANTVGFTPSGTNAIFSGPTGAPTFYVTPAGALTATSATITGTITSGSGSSYTGNQIADAYIGNLTAAKITSGTFTVGGTSQPSEINLIKSVGAIGPTQTALMNWKDSSAGTLRAKIWSDNDGYFGFNSVTGGRFYFYTLNNENVVIQDGVQTIFNNGISCRGTFNVTAYDSRLAGTVYLDDSNNNEYIFGNGGSDTLVGAGTYFYVKIGTYPGSTALRVSSTGTTVYGANALYIADANKIEFKDYTLTMIASKNAILPTSQGFKAVACMESPEEWFMDFCEVKDLLDPLFIEVTSPPYHYIKCEDGEYQVWGKRKGHESKRFEAKTGKEFVANERFLSMNKPSYQFN
jgi:hypothetical protein